MSHFALNFKSCCFHCDVAFIVALLWCRCHSRVVVVPSLSHCCGFVVAVVVSPSHLSWFCHRRCGVTFVIASSWCCRCGFVVAVAVSLSLSHRRHLVVSLLQSCHCMVVV